MWYSVLEGGQAKMMVSQPRILLVAMQVGCLGLGRVRISTSVGDSYDMNDMIYVRVEP